MTFLTELARLKAAATRGGFAGCDAENELGAYLYRHADAIEALVRDATEVNTWGHIPLTPENVPQILDALVEKMEQLGKSLAALDAAGKEKG